MRLDRHKCYVCGRTIPWKSLREDNLKAEDRQWLGLHGDYHEETQILCKKCSDAYRNTYPSQKAQATA